MRFLFLLIPLTLATMCEFNYSKLAYCRLRVVPHFSSGIVERAKRERAWKLTHARKGDTRKGERKMCRLFLRGLIFTRVLLGLLSLRKNGGLLVVYACCAKKVYSSNYMYSGSGFFFLKRDCQFNKTENGCFLVLRKLLFVSFCVVVWVLFSVFSIFCITSLVSATPRNHPENDSISLTID